MDPCFKFDKSVEKNIIKTVKDILYIFTLIIDCPNFDAEFEEILTSEATNTSSYCPPGLVQQETVTKNLL